MPARSTKQYARSTRTATGSRALDAHARWHRLTGQLLNIGEPLSDMDASSLSSLAGAGVGTYQDGSGGGCAREFVGPLIGSEATRGGLRAAGRTRWSLGAVPVTTRAEAHGSPGRFGARKRPWFGREGLQAHLDDDGVDGEDGGGTTATNRTGRRSVGGGEEVGREVDF